MNKKLAETMIEIVKSQLPMNVPETLRAAIRHGLKEIESTKTGLDDESAANNKAIEILAAHIRNYLAQKFSPYYVLSKSGDIQNLWFKIFPEERHGHGND